MNFIGKLISLLLALGLLAFAAIAAFVHFYLTDEKIKSLVIPQAEKALGRSVSIGAIDVGIFSGITISDFAVKEKDQKTDFIQTEKFVLSYDLVPLLKKKLIVNELLLENPSVNIIRGKDGEFNFNSIALLEKPTQEQEKKAPKNRSTAAKTAVPIALTVETIRVSNASLSFIDLKEELPKTDAIANLTVGLDIGMDLSTIKYSGTMDLSASAEYDKASLLAKIESQFNQEELNYAVDLDIDKEKVLLEGKVSDFKTPDVVVNLSSQKLNLDRLMALAALLPKTESSEAAGSPGKAQAAPQKKGKPSAIASSLPQGLHVHGLISIKQALYKKLHIDDFRLEHDLTDGIFTIKDLSAKTAGGSLNSNMRIDLNQPEPQYNGSVAVNSIEVSSLGAGLEQGFANIISGALQSIINFDGAGITPETIKKSLSADASYSLLNGQIKNTEVTKSIASLTGLQELREISFNDMTGTLKLLKGGIIELISSITSTNFSAETEGKVDLDGQIELPILVTLSETMSKKLDAKGSVSKFLANDKGETELRLKVTGPIDSPKTSLDSAGVQKQLEDTLKTKAMDEIGRFLKKQEKNTTPQKGVEATEPQSTEEPVMNLLKGFLGQ